jgi:hypothetical protein
LRVAATWSVALLVGLRVMLFARMYKRSGLVNKNSGR